MSTVTGSKARSSGGLPRLGKLFVESEVARGEASVVYAARLSETSSVRLAVKGWDVALRVLTPEAARFETSIDPAIARFRRADETGELPHDRLYRATDLVRGAPGTLASLGSLRALVTFWAETARALGVAHARGLAHGHVHPGHALLVADVGVPRPLIVDGGVVLTPQAARIKPESAALLAPEAIEELLADRPAPATREADVYGIAASLLGALGSRPRAPTLEALLEAKKRPSKPFVAAAPVGRALDVRALGAVLGAALSPDKDKRPQDGAALAAELSRLLKKDEGGKK